METLQAIVKSSEIQVSEAQKADQAAAVVLRNLTTNEMAIIGGGNLSNVFI